jgi:hypothetical protein
MSSYPKEPYLEQLGVSQSLLSVEEQSCLDRDGYVSLGCLLDNQQLAEIRSLIDEIVEAEGQNTGAELLDSKHIRHPTEPGVIRLADLVNKGAAFDQCYTHPRVLSAVNHVLQTPFKLSALNYRSALPDSGAQKLHVDWHEAVTSDSYQVCNSIWLLDDFTAENGATRVVPGTHLFNGLPEHLLDDPYAHHPQERLLLAPAGTVVVFNSHLWHGGTINKSTLPRRAIHSYYCLYDAPQQVDQQRYFRRETFERLDSAVLTLLDVNKPV